MIAILDVHMSISFICFSFDLSMAERRHLLLDSAKQCDRIDVHLRLSPIIYNINRSKPQNSSEKIPKLANA